MPREPNDNLCKPHTKVPALQNYWRKSFVVLQTKNMEGERGGEGNIALGRCDGEHF
jgi:hypothetical protein